MVRFRLDVLLVLGVLAASSVAAQQAAVVIVVHSALSDTIDLPTVRRVFLARQRYWRDGSVVHAVNQGARTVVRVEFSRRVLGATPQELGGYWNDLWFHGTAPPPVLGSDEAVLRFVSHTPGAIGYVAEAAARAPPDGVRIVLVLPAR